MSVIIHAHVSVNEERSSFAVQSHIYEQMEQSTSDGVLYSIEQTKGVHKESQVANVHCQKHVGLVFWFFSIVFRKTQRMESLTEYSAFRCKVRLQRSPFLDLQF